MDSIQQVRFTNTIVATDADDPLAGINRPVGIILKLEQCDVSDLKHWFAS